MNLRDISTRELYHGRGPSVSSMRFDQHGSARGLCLGQRTLQVLDFIAGQLAPVRVRQATVGDEYGHLTEHGFDAYAPVGGLGPSDLRAGSPRIVGNDFPVRKAEEAADKDIRPLRRDVNAVLGDCLKGRIGRFCRVPIELHVDGAWPLDHHIAADRIRKGSDQYVCSRLLGDLDRLVDVGDEIAGPLRAEGIGNRRLKAE